MNLAVSGMQQSSLRATSLNEIVDIGKVAMIVPEREPNAKGGDFFSSLKSPRHLSFGHDFLYPRRYLFSDGMMNPS
jgi:hypothetical protein